MEHSNDDSLDSERNLFYNKKNNLSPVNRKKSQNSPTTHGIVVTNKSPSKKSPPKQLRKNENDSVIESGLKKNNLSSVNRKKSQNSPTTHGIVVTNKSPSKKSPPKQLRNNENDSVIESGLKKNNLSPVNRKKSQNSPTTHGIVGTNKSPSKKSPPKQLRKNENDSVIESGRASDKKSRNNETETNCGEKDIVESNIPNIKIEHFSSDNESKDESSKSHNTVRVKRNLFIDDDDETILQDQSQTVDTCDRNTSPENISEYPIQRRKLLIKQELISSDDDDDILTSHKDPNKLTTKHILGQQENSLVPDNNRQPNDNDCSDSEIPPSQYWLHEYKESAKNNDEKAGVAKIVKKSSPIKNSPSDKQNTDPKRRSLSNAKVVGQEKLRHKKSPPRITKTEIISEKYQRIEQGILKDQGESYLENNSHGNIVVKEIKNSNSWIEDSGDNKSNVQTFNKNETFKRNMTDKSKLDTSKTIVKKELSPGKKKQSRKKPPNTLPMQKQNLGLKILNDTSSSKAKSNTKTKKAKNILTQHNSDNESTKKSIKTRPNICDDDTSSEEEEENCIGPDKTSNKDVLVIEKPKYLAEESLIPRGTQVDFNLKTREQICENNELNVSVKSQTEKPAQAMSDSDDTDSLTKLNTTINKTMAFMDGPKSTTIKSNKSRKSVSINTKHKLVRTPNDAKTQKSILKRSVQAASSDNSESSSDSQEQNVEAIVQPIEVSPKIIKRPTDLQTLKDQECLTYDSTKASFGLENISDDDEIYIIEVPKTVVPKELKGQSIKLSGKNKLRIGDQIYETCHRDTTNISCVFRADRKQSSYQTVNLKPAGCISLRQKISKSLNVELSPLVKKIVPFPEKLKIRHPLFGTAYEEKIVIANKTFANQISRSRSIKRERSVLKKANEISKLEEKPIKFENIGNQDLKVVHSRKSYNNEHFKDDVEKPQQPNSNSVTNDPDPDSDSDGGFFRKVKLENVKKHEKRKYSKNSLRILNHNETQTTIDLPLNPNKTVIAGNLKQSTNEKLGLSMNSSTVQSNSFLLNAKSSEFFSSTPIKIQNDEKSTEGEISNKKVRKRKTNESHVKVPKSTKKAKTIWTMAAFETKKRKSSL